VVTCGEIDFKRLSQNRWAFYMTKSVAPKQILILDRCFHTKNPIDLMVISRSFYGKTSVSISMPNTHRSMARIFKMLLPEPSTGRTKLIQPDLKAEAMSFAVANPGGPVGLPCFLSVPTTRYAV